MALDGNLSARLKEQISRESETIQSATQQQLDAMRSELSSIYSGALHTIEVDMRGESKALAKRMRSLILWPSLIWLALLLTLSAGAWGIGQYQWSQIQEQRQTLANLEQQEQQDLADLETLGVIPVKQDGKDFLVLPEGATLGDLRQTDSGQPYVQILRE